MIGIDIVKDAIEAKGSFDTVARGMWNRFIIEKASRFEWDAPKEADGVPILARPRVGTQIVNHKLHVPFDRTIVSNKVSYFASNVALSFGDGIPNTVKTFYRNTRISDYSELLYQELGAYCADLGTAYAVLTKVGADIAITTIEPWAALVKHSRVDGEPEWAVIYDKEKAIVYDGIDKSTYAIESKNQKMTWSLVSSEPHGFGTVSRPGIPVIEFPNNPNRIGNAVMTIGLADAYDISLSDLSSEISQTRLAYLLMKGTGADGTEVVETLKKTGVIILDDAGSDAKFITKDMNSEAVDLLQKDLRRLIFEGASSYDPASFSEGATPPTAFEVQQRLSPLENDVSTTLKMWKRSLRYFDYIIQTFMYAFLRSGEYDIAGIERIFRRTAPNNTMGMLVESRQAGIILSNRTKIELSGFQIVADEEEERLEAELGTVMEEVTTEPSMNVE